MFDSKEQEKKNAHALNNPRVGDIWHEMFANRTYVCAIEESGMVKTILLTGAGQEPWLFATVGDFQDWLMYDTAPVRPDGLGGWTWCDLMKHDDDCGDWAAQWEDISKDGYKERGCFTATAEENRPKTVESQEMKF